MDFGGLEDWGGTDDWAAEEEGRGNQVPSGPAVFIFCNEPRPPGHYVCMLRTGTNSRFLPSMSMAANDTHNSSGDARSDSAFVSLLTEHQILLRNFVTSIVPEVDVRADIVQEINIVLWDKRENFELGTNFKAWAFAVARYVIMNNLKRLRRAGRLVFSSEVVDALADQFETLDPEPDERMEALLRCMQILRDEDQQLLLDCHAERGSIERAAEERNQPAATVRSILLRLRRRLRNCIRQRLALTRLAT